MSDLEPLFNLPVLARAHSTIVFLHTDDEGIQHLYIQTAPGSTDESMAAQRSRVVAIANARQVRLSGEATLWDIVSETDDRPDFIELIRSVLPEEVWDTMRATLRTPFHRPADTELLWSQVSDPAFQVSADEHGMFLVQPHNVLSPRAIAGLDDIAEITDAGVRVSSENLHAAVQVVGDSEREQDFVRRAARAMPHLPVPFSGDADFNDFLYNDDDDF